MLGHVHICVAEYASACCGYSWMQISVIMFFVWYCLTDLLFMCACVCVCGGGTNVTLLL